MNPERNFKRVSWASGSDISQVKQFLSEDCPSIAGHKCKDHLQSKTVSIEPSITSKHDDLPPGFEDNHFRNQSKAELSHIIPQIKWESPSKITLNYGWHIASGEDSRERYSQKIREMRVLEAIYPRISAIPSSPSVSFGVEKEHYDDSLTPLIPLTSVEEEVEDSEPESAIKKLECNNVNSHCSGKPLGASATSSSEADIVEAASAAAIAAIIKTNEQGSVIDMDMLLKLFTDPTMIEKLIEEATTVPLSKPLSPEKATVTKSCASAKKVQSTTRGVVKEANYYRNHVEKPQLGNHKEDKRSNENLQGWKSSSSSNTKSHGRVQFRSHKACVYFGSSRGCRNGSSCAFKHELSNKREAGNTLMCQDAKRFKEGPSEGRKYS